MNQIRKTQSEVISCPDKNEILRYGSMFDSIVTREYLQELELCDVIPISQGLKVSSIRWYKIKKIVVEPNASFADKLSMLYMSLHHVAKSVIFVLDKLNKDNVDLYIGARDIRGSYNISGEILRAGLEGYFPGISIEMAGDTSFYGEIDLKNPCVASVSAIASLRDDSNGTFIQGLERLIDATSSIPKFRAYFIADSVGQEETKSMIHAFNDLYSTLSPELNVQQTYQKSQNKGVSESITENLSKTIGESLSKTISHSSGYSKTDTSGGSFGTTNSVSQTFSKSLNANMIFVSGGFGYSGSKSESESVTLSSSSSIGQTDSDSNSYQSGSSQSEQRGKSTQKGSNSSETIGVSNQITYTNRYVKYYLDIIDGHLDRLQNGSPFGLWSTSVYFLANESTTVQKLANIYRGTIIGDESGLGTCAINLWEHGNNAKKIIEYLKVCIQPCFDYKSQILTAGAIVTSKELAIHLSLPQINVPGIVVKEQASFARNVITRKNHTDLDNDDILEVNREKVKLGNILHLGNESKNLVYLNLEELSKHVFVSGTTGSGKSNTLYYLIDELLQKDKKIMVIEPAKGEYKHIFGNRDDVTVYSASPKVGKLLTINPFEFPWQSIDILAHIDQLVEIFNACWPMYSAMPSVLKNSLISAYERCGWDLLLTKNPYTQADNITPVFPSIEDVLSCLKNFINNSEFSAEVKSNYKGALEVRLNDLNTGLMKYVLAADSISDDELFNKNCIIDLSTIRSSETKSLLMGFLVMKLNQFRISEGGMNRSLRHVTILEEAHNLLKRTSSTQDMESSNLAGKSVEMISNSIAEMRTYGEAFVIVDQSPLLLDTSVIRNTNTKIVLSLPEAGDREIIGKSMSLTEQQIDQIARQNVGEAIVYQNSWEEAVQCKIIEYIYDKETTFNKTYPLNLKKAQSTKRKSLINFLLNPYTKKDFVLDDLQRLILSDGLSSSLTVDLLKIMEEYRSTSNLSIWNKDNFSLLGDLLSRYLGIDNEVIKIKMIIPTFGGALKARALFDDLLRRTIDEDLDKFDLFFIQQTYFRTLRHELYLQWIKTFK